MTTKKRGYLIARLGIPLALLAMLAMLAFVAGRGLAPVEVGADQADDPLGPGAGTATRVPGQLPDTSEPLWYLPYLREDDAKPKFDQNINGIEVGPTAPWPGCADGSMFNAAERESVADSPVEIAPERLPDDAEVDEEGAATCGGFAAFSQVTW